MDILLVGIPFNFDRSAEFSTPKGDQMYMFLLYTAYILLGSVQFLYYLIMMLCVSVQYSDAKKTVNTQSEHTFNSKQRSHEIWPLFLEIAKCYNL